MRKGVRIEDAAHEWVSSFNAYPENMIRMVIEASHYTEFNEVTPPGNGDRVYLLERDEYGRIESHEDDMFEIETDSGDTVRISGDQLDVERDGDLPMWGTLWGFGDSADDYWLEELGGLQIMSDLGFRIYESEEFGYIFGIDGCGYSFYEAHWIPLYKARGLQWHDPDADKPEPLVKITCYGQTEELTRDDAIKKYLDGVRCCEGAERDRYLNIYLQLLDGCEECSDEDIQTMY